MASEGQMPGLQQGKAKRGGPVDYLLLMQESEFLLFSVYAKGEMADPAPAHCKTLAELLKNSQGGRRKP